MTCYRLGDEDRRKKLNAGIEAEQPQHIYRAAPRPSIARRHSGFCFVGRDLAGQTKTKPILASENPTRRRHGLRLVIEQPPQSRQSATRLDDATITSENALQDLWIARHGRIDRFLPSGIGHEYRLTDRPAFCIDRPNSDHGSSQTDRGHILAVCVGDCEHVADRAGRARPRPK
jgi:hypothetical protein